MTPALPICDPDLIDPRPLLADRCQACNGWGRIRRLDASYMRRFGLREWDGCEACGGDRDRPGTGERIRHG